MDNNRNLIITSLVIISIFAILLLGFIFLFQNSAAEPVSTLDLNPSPSVSATSPTPESEPVVTSWRTYSNTQYEFSIQVPAGWKEQDYASFYPNGGTLVAFSPNDLPCGTCTYFHSGYYSIRIYNQKTDPELYQMFMQRVQSIGKSKDYQKSVLAETPALLFANTISVEKNGWIYELALDKDNGNATITESQIFQKAASSFAFTHLFDN